jgi:hypothetical protein
MHKLLIGCAVLFVMFLAPADAGADWAKVEPMATCSAYYSWNATEPTTTA